MNKKIIITMILFIFSILLIKNGVYFIKNNDNLMKTLKEKQDTYYVKPADAIITENTMIPGIKGKKVNLDKSYQKMKSLNNFTESLLVFDEIVPTKSIHNIYDKVIISGNPNLNRISIITELDDKYCYTFDLTIKKECVQNNKYTILIHKINNNYLTEIKDNIQNGKVFFLESHYQNELNLVIKYLKNNNYEIVSINELIKE